MILPQPVRRSEAPVVRRSDMGQQEYPVADWRRTKALANLALTMSRVSRFLTLLIPLLVGMQRLASAQEVRVTLGMARTIKSVILNEERRVLVHLPASYDTSGKSYPVLYLLDGTEDSLRDQYDPDQAIHRQMVEFSALVKDKLGAAISYRYETYQDYPHVPFPCLYDGLRFVTADPPKK